MMTITYHMDCDISFGEIGRMSYEDAINVYADWVVAQISAAYPEATVGYEYHRQSLVVERVEVDGAETVGEDTEGVKEHVERLLADSFDYEGFVEVPTLEELTTAPYLYELPGYIVRDILQGIDPYTPLASNEDILEVVTAYDPETYVESDLSRIQRRIADEGLEYLWRMGMTRDSIKDVHKPLAIALLSGLDPRPIYEAWCDAERLFDGRMQLIASRDAVVASIESKRREIRMLERAIRVDEDVRRDFDAGIAARSELIAAEVARHRAEKSAQWDALRHLQNAETIRRKNEAGRERLAAIRATLEAMVAGGDTRVRRSESGKQIVIVGADGKTVPPPNPDDLVAWEWYLSKNGIEI